VVTTPVPVADLSLTKIVNNATPNVGVDVVFTATLTNGGPSTATGVAVTDLLPAGYSFVSATPSQGAYNSATGVWSVGSVASGASATLALTATVNAAGSYTNLAEVTASGTLDPDSAPNNCGGGVNLQDDCSTAATVPTPVINLSLTKTVDNATPAVGTDVVFTITVSNAVGYSNATGVVVTDLLPTGYNWVTDDSAGAYAPGTGLWTAGPVAAGASATLQITATVLGSGVYTNAAEVTAADQSDANDTFGNGMGDDYDEATPSPTAMADLSLTKSVDNPTPTVGTDVVFTITVENPPGYSDATGVEVTDLLPTGYSYVSDDAGGAYDSGSGVWTVGTVAAGTSATLGITATVLGAGDYANLAEVTASATPDVDSTPANCDGGNVPDDDCAIATTTP
jgi:uncharacterized repeat protein (TIGR01451 family)